MIFSNKTYTDIHKKSIRGNFFIVIAPSGAGKSTLINALLKQEPNIKLSISCTTRSPRSGEKHGREYYFITKETFLKYQNNGQFIEWATVHKNYYGTLEKTITNQIKNDTDILLEIDWQGAIQIKKRFSNVISIFILPPSINALKERLKKRGLDKPQIISQRILAAKDEISHAIECEYVIINQDFKIALLQLTEIIHAARYRFFQQAARNIFLFKELNIYQINTS